MTDATPGSAPSSNRNVMILLSYLGCFSLVPLLTEKNDRSAMACQAWPGTDNGGALLWIVISIVIGARYLRLHRRRHAAARSAS